jgi:ribosome-associated translation inhibitor RaiA
MHTVLRDVTHSLDPSIEPAVHAYAQRRLSFALRRFADRIQRVTVRVVDVNGPKGGVDSRCLVEADLAGGASVRAEATTAWPFASITRAAARLSRAIERRLVRGREAPRRAARRFRSRARVSG